MFFSTECEFKKALRDTLMEAAWYELLSTIGSFRLDYEYEIEYEYDLRISDQ